MKFVQFLRMRLCLWFLERTIFVLICQLGDSMYQFGASRLASSFNLCVTSFIFLLGFMVLINGDGGWEP